MRTIRTYGDGPSSAVHDALAGVFSAELLAPSRSIWLVSPWISDIPVLDNRHGEFSGISGALPRRLLTLVDVLGRLGRDPACSLTVVTRKVKENKTILQALSAFEDGTCTLVLAPKVHEKTFLTDRVLVTGSMNFTFGGTSSNEEVVSIDADPTRVNETHVQFVDRHGGPR